MDGLLTNPFLKKARTVFAVFGGVYVVAVGLLTIPYFQGQSVYLYLRLHTHLSNLISAQYILMLFVFLGLPTLTPQRDTVFLVRYLLLLLHLTVSDLITANKTYNFKIQTSDNETLGSWFILSDRQYQSIPFPPQSPELLISDAVRGSPTILFLHGNAATRAFNARVQHYQAYSSRLHANVLAIDYRGFAESSGAPSEDGLVRDARAAWEWLISQGAKGEDILIVGHSLGTGVGARLAAELSDEGVNYRGVVLMSPFSSIEEVLKTYNVFGAVPLMKPLSMIPYAASELC